MFTKSTHLSLYSEAPYRFLPFGSRGLLHFEFLSLFLGEGDADSIRCSRVMAVAIWLPIVCTSDGVPACTWLVCCQASLRLLSGRKSPPPLYKLRPCISCAARYLLRAYVCRWGRIAGLSTALQISYALVQATVGVGTVLIWDFGIAYTRGGRGINQHVVGEMCY